MWETCGIYAKVDINTFSTHKESLNTIQQDSPWWTGNKGGLLRSKCRVAKSAPTLRQGAKFFSP